MDDYLEELLELSVQSFPGEQGPCDSEISDHENDVDECAYF